MNSNNTGVSETLTTIKDYIRWASSRFTENDIFLGQGTASSLDEAAAIVLHTLHQPYNLAESYFDAVLTLEERLQIITLINQRINERKPAAYLTHEAIFAGLSFYVDERVLIPRSPIAELIEELFQPWINESDVIGILDLCTGSGCIAIACAYAFPNAMIDAIDLSADALQVAEINRKQHYLEQQLTFHQADLFNGLEQNPYDIIVSNPPYVSMNEWQQLPAEYHAEPKLGFVAGESGLELVLKILINAPDYLSEQGILVVEVGSSAEILQNSFPSVPFYWLDFKRGGDGVFLLTAAQLKEHNALFSDSIKLFS